MSYMPVYAGLFIAQLMAVMSNAVLDFRYASMPLWMVVWSVAFGVSLCIGASQNGQLTVLGKRGMTVVLVVGGAFSLLLLLAMGPVRGLVYVLGFILAGYNCQAVSMRQIYFGLVATVVIVLCAVAKPWADWTMAFYLLPYVVAAVATLVAGQSRRRLGTLQAGNMHLQRVGAQGVATVTATLGILLMGGLLYVITPQKLLYQLTAAQAVTEVGAAAKAGGASSGPAVSGMAAELRQASRREGLPGWQSQLLDGLADMVEAAGRQAGKLTQYAADLLEMLRKLLEEHAAVAQWLTFLALLVSLLLTLWRLLREEQVGLWVLAGLDYLRLGVLAWSSPGRAGVCQYYHAMTRLLAQDGLHRDRHANAREYLDEVAARRAFLHEQMSEMTALFELARYGDVAIDDRHVRRMRVLYRSAYQMVM